MGRATARDSLLLARVRRGLRALDSAISRGAAEAGLTMQQQAFLLAIAAYGASVPLADVREELEMDRATASALLRRLIDRHLVRRSTAEDRRAFRLALTAEGRAVYDRSVDAIRRELRGAEHRNELAALRLDLDAYFAYYLGRAVTVRAGAKASRRGSARE
jgi:DNA-binding MarR family transcriptional regulator